MKSLYKLLTILPLICTFNEVYYGQKKVILPKGEEALAVTTYISMFSPDDRHFTYIWQILLTYVDNTIFLAGTPY